MNALPFDPSDATKPLVTFAVLTYNHEKYIREALEGAFCQSYSPLEILISDDNSTDQTYEVIHEMVAFYRGPHKVIVNQNRTNLGIGGQVNRMFELASGEILIFAAGDDISVASRTQCVVDCFQSNNLAMAVLSAHSIMDECGKLIKQHHGKLGRFFREITRPIICASGGGYGLGAAYSYRKQVGFWPEPFPVTLMNEDRLLPLRAVLLGNIEYIPKPLVQYRQSENGLSRRLTPSQISALGKPSHMNHVYQTIRFAQVKKKISSLEGFMLKAICSLAVAKCYTDLRFENDGIVRKAIWFKKLVLECMLKTLLLLNHLIFRPYRFLKSFKNLHL